MESKNNALPSFAILEDQVTGLPTPDSDTDRSFDELRAYPLSLEPSHNSFYRGTSRYKTIEEEDEELDIGTQSLTHSADVSFNSPSFEDASSPLPSSNNSTISDSGEQPTSLSSPSRRISAVTVSSISELEPEDKYPIQYTPLRNRAAFHSPDSAANAMRAENGAKLRSAKPKRARGENGLHVSPLRHRSSPTQASPMSRSSPKVSERGSPPSVKSMRNARAMINGGTLQSQTSAEKQRLAPLVLLHVTVLQPAEAEYPDTLLSEVLPSKVLSRFKTSQAALLQKLSPVVRQRGILLRHPRNDFNELVDSVLESLGLENDEESTSDEEIDGKDLEGQNEQMVQGCKDIENHEDDGDSDDTACETYCPTPQLSQGCGQDHKICSTCGRLRRFLRIQESATSNRYDVKVYAANGLVGPQVWEAVWHEMERVDVEINVILLEKWRAAINERARECEKEAEEQSLMDQMTEKGTSTKEKDVGSDGLKTPNHFVRTDGQQSRQLSGSSDLLKMTGPRKRQGQQSDDYHSTANTGEEISAKTPSDPRLDKREHTVKRSVSCEKLFQMFTGPAQTTENHERQSQVPFPELIKNYVWLLAQDTRNVVFIALGIAALVFFMIRTTATSSDQVATMESQLPVLDSVVPLGVVESSSFMPVVEIVESTRERLTETPSASMTTATREEEPTIEQPETEVSESGLIQIYEERPPEPPEPLEPPEP